MSRPDLPVRMTRICATIGPASSSVAALTGLVRAGMDLARLNFSHGKPEEHARVVRRLRSVARKAGRPVGVMQDLQGPRIRLGDVKDGAVVLRPGAAPSLAGSAGVSGGAADSRGRTSVARPARGRATPPGRPGAR